MHLPTQRLVFIDGLRGIAASAVVLCHLGARTMLDPATKYGYLGVAVFFVLSGFVISMSVGNRSISLGFLGRFAARRAIRLDPPYWCSIFLAIALAAVAAKLGMHREMPDGLTVLAHLFYLQDILELQPISLIYWTLAFEVQFYVALILVLWTGRRWFLPLWIAMYAWSLLENAGLVNIVPGSIFIQYWFAFALGATTHYVIAGRLPGWVLGAAMIAGLAFMPFRHAEWLITAMVTAGVIYLAHRRGAMSSWLSDRVSQFAGRISYSLYLFHPLVGWTAQSVALKFVDPLPALAVGLVASIISAWLAYVLVETYSMKLSRRVSLDGGKQKPALESTALQP